MTHNVLRLLSVGIILGAVASDASPASAAPTQCGFTILEGCPGDISWYDQRCKSICGYTTYAGACLDGGTSAYIVCYYEVK